MLQTRFGTPAQPGDAREIRLTIVQYGDYAEGFHRFRSGGAETYYAQKYTVEYVASLARRLSSVTVVNCSVDLPPVQLPNGVQTVGVELYPNGQRPRHKVLIDVVEKTTPTHLVAMLPSIPLITWAINANVTTLPMFAGGFHARGLKGKVKHWLLAKLLNHASIGIVANHNVSASVDLKRIGVDSTKIVPFDWPAFISPKNFPPKSLASGAGPFRLIYVGAVIPTKGVGDGITAVSLLRDRGKRIELTIIGRGDIDQFKRRAAELRIQDHIAFLGQRSHDDVLAAMRDHDGVVVPSHWAYPEGLPMTLYEALCTRTPLIASDHPMFARKIRNRKNALIFPAQNAVALANCIDELASSPELYARLSIAGESAAENYLCPVKYDEMISAFVDRRHVDLRKYALANYAY
jgi:glycosyltransferase involved in cell wall biosynthesis